ncbi:MAG: hypothetical protein IT313_02995 [Anaerolineales bacterium]|nr:hypothetical protein [Anaerolineales bacterium]
MVKNNSSDIQKIPSKSRGKPASNAKWQDKRLPLMSRLLIGLTLFFFIVSFVQMAYLHWSILQSPPVEIDQSGGETVLSSAESFADRLSARELEVRSKMEAYIVSQRYHQASLLLMSGLWIRYLGFMTGMILALVGASFILGKLREPRTKIEGKASNATFSLLTTSPGIILAVLGAILVFATIMDKDAYEVKDSNTYLFLVEERDHQRQPSSTLPSPEDAFETPAPAP